MRKFLVITVLIFSWSYGSAQSSQRIAHPNLTDVFYSDKLTAIRALRDARYTDAETGVRSVQRTWKVKSGLNTSMWRILIDILLIRQKYVEAISTITRVTEEYIPSFEEPERYWL